MLELHLTRPRPGHPDWQTLAQEARAAAERLAPSLTAPVGGRRERRRRLRAYVRTARHFRTNRRLDRAGREDLRPLYFIWTLLRSCNFRCSYCDDHRGRRYPDLPGAGTLTTDEGLRLLRVLRSGIPSVFFAGGEPTLRRDLPRLTRTARELDYFPIAVNTNASLVHRLLARPAWRSWLADTDVVVVSLDALEPSVLRPMWGCRRPEDVLRNLLLLRELAAPLRFKLMVNTVIQPDRVELARDVLDFANDLGVWFTPVPMNVGPSVHRGLIDEPAYRALVELILERKRQGHRITGSLRMNRRLLRAEPFDCRNALKPHVDHDGSLLWPCKAAVNVPPVRIRVLDYPDVEALYAAAVRAIDPTGFHGSGPRQCGASCCWAQNYSTDAYVHGLRHPWTLVREVAEYVRAA